MNHKTYFCAILLFSSSNFCMKSMLKRLKDDYYGHDVTVLSDLKTNHSDRSKLPLDKLTHESHRVEWALENAIGKPEFYEIEKLRKARNVPINKKVLKRIKETHRQSYPLVIQTIINSARGQNQEFIFEKLDEKKQANTTSKVSTAIHYYVERGETIHITEALKLCKQHKIPLTPQVAKLTRTYFAEKKEKRIDKAKKQLAILTKKLEATRR